MVCVGVWNGGLTWARASMRTVRASVQLGKLSFVVSCGYILEGEWFASVYFDRWSTSVDKVLDVPVQ